MFFLYGLKNLLKLKSIRLAVIVLFFVVFVNKLFGLTI